MFQMTGLLFVNNDGKQIILNFLMMIIFMTIVAKIVLADDKYKSIIVRGNNETEWHSIRYPYKSVYGLYERLKCDGSIHERFHECERSAHHSWVITIDDYFYKTKKFCCFIWQTLDCEIDVAGECNKEYSKKLETNTEQSFKSMCDEVGSARGSTSCWLTQDRQETIAWIIGIIIFILTLVCACLGIRSYNSRTKTTNTGIAKTKLEISEPFNYRKETHLFVGKNYSQVVGELKTRELKYGTPPIPPVIIQENKSFLHYGGGPITYSSKVLKNTPSSTSKTIMTKQAATTTTTTTSPPRTLTSALKSKRKPNLLNKSILRTNSTSPRVLKNKTTPRKVTFATESVIIPSSSSPIPTINQPRTATILTSSLSSLSSLDYAGLPETRI
ncbi:uncharacterized protein LOC124493324 [Dermatophagoides farinae]|uniref:uncharacterized protein LOC124493324 n=1 Tax=Dermatophagoides farinae TaxID=6954 RepID=UPI003F5F52F9